MTLSDLPFTPNHIHEENVKKVSKFIDLPFIPDAPAVPELTNQLALRIVLILFIITLITINLLTIKQLFAHPEPTRQTKGFEQFTKWHGVMKQGLYIDPIIPMLDEVKKDKAEDQIEYVNALINDMLDYKLEREGFDHWQSPAESIKLGTGDCEDFAILKFTALRYLGFDPKLLMVWDVTTQNYHMVTLVNDQILDSKTPPVNPLLYVKIYTLDEKSWGVSKS